MPHGGHPLLPCRRPWRLHLYGTGCPVLGSLCAALVLEGHWRRSAYMYAGRASDERGIWRPGRRALSSLDGARFVVGAPTWCGWQCGPQVGERWVQGQPTNREMCESSRGNGVSWHAGPGISGAMISLADRFWASARVNWLDKVGRWVAVEGSRAWFQWIEPKARLFYFIFFLGFPFSLFSFSNSNSKFVA
jgi:hypothetical protein